MPVDLDAFIQEQEKQLGYLRDQESSLRRDLEKLERDIEFAKGRRMAHEELLEKLKKEHQKP